MPPRSGEITQLTAILPISPQETIARALSPPIVVKPIVSPAPTIPPTIEWVVEIGSPFLDAINSQIPELKSADIIISTKSIGSVPSCGKLTMPSRMVLVTSPPANIAPLSSKIAAITRACFIVTVLAPTLVPKEFATSLPPMLNAIKIPKILAILKSKK